MRRTSTSLLLALILTGCGKVDRPAVAALPAAGPVPAPPVAATQDAEPFPEQPTLDETIALAQRRNRDFQVTLSVLERSRSSLTAAWSEVFTPQATASWAVARTRTRSDDAWSDETTRNALARLGLRSRVAGFTVEPFVEEGWDDGAEPGAFRSAIGVTLARRLLQFHEATRLRQPVTRAERELAIAANALAQAERDLRREATRLYAELVRALARNRLRARRVDDAQAFLLATEAAVEHGFKAPIERINAQISLNQAQADIAEDRTRVANARESLLVFLDLPLTRPLDPQQDVAPPGHELPTVDTDLQTARTSVSSLVAKRLTLEGVKDDLVLADDAVAPQATASLDAAERRRGYGSTGAELKRELYIAAKVELVFSVDGQTAERARADIARRKLVESRLQLAQAEAQVELDVRRLRRRIAQLGESLALAEARRTAEKAKLAASEASWKAGRVDNLELTRAQQAVDASEIAVIDARTELALAYSERQALLP